MHSFKEMSENKNRKELIVEKFFDYENCTTNCDKIIEVNGVMNASIYYTIMCNQQGSHKGNSGACSYMDLYLTVTNSQTGQVIRDGAVYQSGCCHGDRKLYINNQHLMNISYGFPVDIKLRIKAITCTYKAHIWGGRSWIAVLRYVGAKLLVQSYATNNIETDVDFAISRKNEYFSPSNTYKKLTIIEDALGHEFDIELNAKLAYSLFKKALNSNKYKCTDITGNFEEISVVEKDRDNIEKCYNLDELKVDYNPFKFQLDTKKINNINKPVFEKVFCYKNIKLSITVLSRISKSNNSDVEMTLEFMIENDKKGESITNASETFYVDLIGNYKIVKKVEV